jgi:hypothetical protein
MSLSPPLPPSTSPPTSDDGNGLYFLLFLLVPLLCAEWKFELIQKQWRGNQLRGDPLNPRNISILQDSSPSELAAETPALFVEFMRADRLDILAQDTESQKSKELSDGVSKRIKERRENKNYLPKTIHSAKCYIDSDRAPGENWQPLAPKLLQRCKETNGRFILLKTPDCKKVGRQDQGLRLRKRS